MKFIDKFIDTSYKLTNTKKIQKGKYVINIEQPELISTEDYPHLPLSSIGEKYKYIKRASASVHEYKTTAEASQHLNKRETVADTPFHEDLFIEFLPVDRTITEDIYYFRCIGDDNAVILMCSTESQDKAAEYWNSALTRYEEKSKFLIDNLLDLFLHLSVKTCTLILQDNKFKEMLAYVNENTDTESYTAELEFLHKKISQIDPTFNAKITPDDLV